jgi:hypothetical protein
MAIGQEFQMGRQFCLNGVDLIDYQRQLIQFEMVKTMDNGDRKYKWPLMQAMASPSIATVVTWFLRFRCWVLLD